MHCQRYESCHVGSNDKQALSLKRTNKEYVYCRLLGRLLSKLLRSKKGKWKIKNSVILKLSMKEVAVTNKENYIANTSALEHWKTTNREYGSCWPVGHHFAKQINKRTNKISKHFD